MSVSADTWAIVLATAFGPIGAVLISLWRERRRELRGRQLYVFRTLMATRKLAVAPEHFNAVNLVEVDYYGCAKVQIAWKAYKDHLNDISVKEDESWREKKERLLANLLFEMASLLGFSIPALEIFKGGYAPSGYAYRDSRATAALEYMYQLSQGTAAVPIKIVP